MTPLAVAAVLSGGFYESTYSLLAAAVWLSLAFVAAFRGAPRPPLAAWLLLALAAWTAVSAWWGGAAPAFRVVPLALLYAGAAYAAAWVDPERLLRAVLAVATVVVGAGMVALALGVAPDAAGPESDRLAWPIGYANGLGLVSGVVVLLALGVRLVPVAVVGALALALTYSRGAILATAAGALALTALRVRVARWAVVAAAAALAALAVVAAQPLAARFAAPAPDERDARRLLDVSGHGRSELWRVAWEQARDHPIVGDGAGTWPRAYIAETGSLSGPANAHSLYLETLGELGIVGLTLLVAIIVVVARAGTRARGHAWARAATAVFVAVMVQAAADWTWQLPAAMLPAAFAAGALTRDKLSQSASGEAENQDQPPRARAFTCDELAQVQDGAAARDRDNLSRSSRRAAAVSAAALLLGAAAGLHGVGAALVETGISTAAERRAAALLLPGDARPDVAFAEAQRRQGDLPGAAASFRRACDRDRREPSLRRAHPSFGGCRSR